MNTRKTQRKNKTKQVMTWPSSDTYFTIDSLVAGNQHMLTTSGSDITLRVRLNKAINEENLVAVIGHKNSGKGRPQLVFATKPVSQLALDKASADEIMLDTPRVMPVLNIKPTSSVSTSPVRPVNYPQSTTV